MRKLVFGNKATNFGVRLVEGLKFLIDLRKDFSYLNKNLFWYRFEDIFPHISILYLVYFYDDQDFLKQLQQHYFSHYKKEIIKEPLLTGTDIVKILGISPSKQVGIIKERLILAQLEGKVKTKKEAIDFIKTIKI